MIFEVFGLQMRIKFSPIHFIIFSSLLIFTVCFPALGTEKDDVDQFVEDLEEEIVSFPFML